MGAARTRQLKLLLVDDEESLLWSLTQRVRRERPNWTVETANDGVAALERLRAETFDGLVIDIRMPRMNGLEVVVATRTTQPTLPVVVMTAYPTTDLLDDLRQRGTIEYLEKPFEFSNFLSAVERAIEKGQTNGFTGSILVQTLPDVVQLYALSRATGALQVRCDGRSGFIWFERGEIPHAGTATLSGESAFYEIMKWSGGEFSMKLGEAAPERTIHSGWMELVMESCRIADEERLLGSGPASTSFASSGSGWTLAPPPIEEPATESPSAFGSDVNNPNPPTTESGVPPMATIKESLSKLDTVDGFIGACLCDSESGMVLGTEGGGSINLEVAGAANTEVVRAKRKAAKSLGLKDDIEDILITLGKQYHMIRPLKSKPQVFFYVALDRSRANLGLARLTLADVEKDLQL